jgi:acetyl-CoA C-acetyltransferase
MLKREVTVEEVLAARIISWPFGLYDCAAQSDGAAAAIITRRELAKGFRDDFVLVRAIAIALAPDPKEDPDFDFLRWKPTVYAARQAYAQAGITQPRKEIDLAQVHDCSSPTRTSASARRARRRSTSGAGPLRSTGSCRSTPTAA